ncbi:hypothetical protein [Glaesserella sp.]|uniref:hypothetical protein n=1 Tax=Glaesserella sp. TaxID=2094731 RepID=UPI00359F50F3
MKVLWNYMFFCTWKILSKIAIENLVFFIPYYRNNRSKIEKISHDLIHGEKVGINILYTYRLFLLTTSVFYGTLTFFFFYFFRIEFSGKSTVFILVVVISILSYITNEYLLSWNKNGYIEYFKIFKRKINKLKELCVFLSFHLGMLVFAILSVYFTIFYK